HSAFLIFHSFTFTQPHCFTYNCALPGSVPASINGSGSVSAEARDGTFAMTLPGVTGVEGAGVVEAVGPGVKDIKPGDRMAYFLSPGSYAAVRLVNAADLIPTPADLSSAEVATILTKGLTAWAALNGFYHLNAGAKVLVQGASSHVGQLLAR